MILKFVLMVFPSFLTIKGGYANLNVYQLMLLFWVYYSDFWHIL